MNFLTNKKIGPPSEDIVTRPGTPGTPGIKVFSIQLNESILNFDDS